MKIASVVISRNDLDILGLWLQRDPNDTLRLSTLCQDTKQAAYQILCSFYNSVPNNRRWGLLIDALVNLDQRVKVRELGLDELHKNSQSQPH